MHLSNLQGFCGPSLLLFLVSPFCPRFSLFFLCRTISCPRRLSGPHSRCLDLDLFPPGDSAPSSLCLSLVAVLLFFFYVFVPFLLSPVLKECLNFALVSLCGLSRSQWWNEVMLLVSYLFSSSWQFLDVFLIILYS